jgi:uncharacterized protein HemX
MARNRKSQSVAIRFGPALKALLLCLLIGGSGVGYVWQKEQINKLGQQYRAKELRLTNLVKQNGQLQQQLGYMRSPTYLQQQIRKLGVTLAQPKDSQIIRLREPSAEPLRIEREPQYAARGDRPSWQQ